MSGGAFQPGSVDFTLDGPGNPTLALTDGATASLPGSLYVGRTPGPDEVSVWRCGLTYGVLPGDFNETDENPGDQGIQLGPMATEITTMSGYATCIYTG